MISRPLAFICICFLLLPGVGWTQDVEIVRVLVDYREKESMIRLKEYFAGKYLEPAGAVARTDPAERSGLYFQLFLDRPVSELPEGIAGELALILPESPEPVVHTFQPVPTRGHAKWILLGLTGEAWPEDPDIPQPTAWRVRLLDASGSVIVEERSFLWGNR